ncbi:MAG: tagaturonate epimerase family protein [Candidatus Neomarinimicrobiota bacterium]
MDNNKPSVLGLKRSFGFGDRLGLATPGHMDAVAGTPYLGIFAQQSIRELNRTNRQPADVMNAASKAVERAGWDQPWGADADHLQTREDVLRMADAGYTFFTIDPSAYVNNAADMLSPDALLGTYQGLVTQKQLVEPDLLERYLEESFEISDSFKLVFDDRAILLKAIIKYGSALKYTRSMYHWIREACSDRPFEVEMSVDETATPTTPLEHLFVGLELKRMGVDVISLAPRFVGAFEKGIDYKGAIAEFAEQYRQHAAIARYCGPYKLSIHSGSDKFSIYPIIGCISGEHLHVKTAGTSYLEALRVICLTDKALFREIVEFCRSRFDADKQSYHVSAALSQVPASIDNRELEHWYLTKEAGRQILHVTFGSVLFGGKTIKGVSYKDLIIENLINNDQLYRDVLNRHLGKHISLLLSETGS